MWSLLFWVSRPATADILARPEIPCLDTSPSCLSELQSLAIANSREVRVLEQAIANREERLWTNSLPAVTVGQSLGGEFRGSVSLDLVAIAGGGQRANSELEIARLEAQLENLKDQLALNVVERLVAYLDAQGQVEASQRRLAQQEMLVAVVEVDYRRGNRDTASMLPLWSQIEEREAQVVEAENSLLLAELRLQNLLSSPTITPEDHDSDAPPLARQSRSGPNPTPPNEDRHPH